MSLSTEVGATIGVCKNAYFGKSTVIPVSGLEWSHEPTYYNFDSETYFADHINVFVSVSCNDNSYLTNGMSVADPPG